MTRYHQFLATLMLLALLLCSALQATVFAQPWLSPLFLDHPLLGKIWDSNKEAWISAEQLALEMRQYDYLLLGENHSNPDHHRLQAKLIHDLANAGQKPSVVMEMLAISSWKDQPRNWPELAPLQQMASQRNVGWEWDIYTPILEAVVQHKLDLFAGNIASKALHAGLMSKENKVDAHSIQAVHKEYRIDTTALKTLERNIVESHCGHANAELIQFMTTAQLRRDHIMTSSLLEQDKPVVLIAGAGHVRNDYAISAQLLHKYRILSFMSVAFIEVQKDKQNPEDYLPKNNAGDLNKVFDILYFTASNTKEDPCVKFRKQLKNMQHKQTPNSE